MSLARPRVAIIGGGIGGLFAANAMIAHGLDVSVYEQAPELGEIGAGFYVTPNSVRHLQRVGLGDEVEKWGALVGEGSQYLRHDGSPIAPVQVTDATGWNATYGMHRADFVDLLAAGLPDGVVHCGYRGAGFEQSDDTARVTFENGAEVEADVVVAADGIHSTLRPSVFPPSTPVFHGTISYRGLVAREKIPDWPVDRWLMWAGPSKHFLVFPETGITTADIVLQTGNGEEILVIGQGANQAIEDGMALAVILSQTDKSSAPAALLAYEKLRRERVAEVQLGARQNGLRVDSMSKYTDLKLRDTELTNHAEFRKHLYAYDVLPEAEAAAASL